MMNALLARDGTIFKNCSVEIKIGILGEVIIALLSLYLLNLVVLPKNYNGPYSIIFNDLLGESKKNTLKSANFFRFLPAQYFLFHFEHRSLRL